MIEIDERRRPGPIRVLCVEDDAVDRLAIERMVREKKLPYETTFAETIEDARVALSAHRFDVVIADYQLPDGTGTELLDARAEQPFLLVTGNLEESLAARTIEQGIDDYLIKDPNQRHLEALPASVTKALRRWEVGERRRAAEASLREAHANLQALATQLSELNEALWRSFGAHASSPPVAPGLARLDDAGRLAALTRTGMMDSPADASFDRFTDLGAKLLQVPVCLISLVDDHRLFFKSAHGLPEPWASRREIPLSHSFCQCVVTSGLPLAVADTTQNPLFRDNGVMTDMGMAAYLGVPLTTPEGHTLGSFCAIDTRPRQWTDADRTTLERVAQSVLAETAVHMQLAELEERVRERTSQLLEAMRLASVACEAGRMGAWHLDVENNRVTYSDELLALIGIDKSQFGGTLEAVEAFTHPDDIERRRKDRADALAQGEWLEHDYRIIRPGGEVRWMHSRGQIVRRADGTALKAYGMTLDITERKRAEEQLRFLMKELSHRSKNLMAVVQAISWQTSRRSVRLEDFEKRFTQRLEALGRSHDLLVGRNWQGVALEDLVRAQLKPFLDLAQARITVDGAPLLLMPAAAQDLGLALHELATNASKYGALSVPTGKIGIAWTIDDGGPAGAKRFVMTWRESGGPPVSRPVRKGFGSRVITSTLSTSFKGKAKVDYPREGLSWELAAPIGHVIRELP